MPKDTASEIIKKYNKYKEMQQKATQKKIKYNIDAFLKNNFYNLDVETQEQVLNCIDYLLNVLRDA